MDGKGSGWTTILRSCQVFTVKSLVVCLYSCVLVSIDIIHCLSPPVFLSLSLEFPVQLKTSDIVGQVLVYQCGHPKVLFVAENKVCASTNTKAVYGICTDIHNEHRLASFVETQASCFFFPCWVSCHFVLLGLPSCTLPFFSCHVSWCIPVITYLACTILGQIEAFYEMFTLPNLIVAHWKI